MPAFVLVAGHRAAWGLWRRLGEHPAERAARQAGSVGGGGGVRQNKARKAKTRDFFSLRTAYPLYRLHSSAFWLEAKRVGLGSHSFASLFVIQAVTNLDKSAYSSGCRRKSSSSGSPHHPNYARVVLWSPSSCRPRPSLFFSQRVSTHSSVKLVSKETPAMSQPLAASISGRPTLNPSPPETITMACRLPPPSLLPAEALRALGSH